jgi:hypothetical protein
MTGCISIAISRLIRRIAHDAHYLDTVAAADASGALHRSAGRAPEEIVLRNGSVITVDYDDRIVDAVAVTGNRIVSRVI